MTLVLDAGALIAIDRGDRAMVRRLKTELEQRTEPRTHPGVVAQVWRDGARQARLASALTGVDVVPLDEAWARRCGALLARAGGADVVDAGVALLAEDGDDICSADVEDIAALVTASGRHVEVIAV